MAQRSQGAAIGMTDEAYERLALHERERHWELYGGRLVAKPGSTAAHADIIDRLYARLVPQAPYEEYGLRAAAARLRCGKGYYIEADFTVVPRVLVRQQIRERFDQLEVYEAAVPLVVDVQSPLNARYDFNAKLSLYQQRGDLEIWRLHSVERTFTVWRRQPDGSYTQTSLAGGRIQLAALPGVAIVIEELFD